MKCYRCGESKPETAFYTDKSRQTGYSSRCRTCAIADAKAVQANDPGRKQYMRKYYEAHETQWKRYGRKRYQAVRREMIAAARKWRQANTERHNASCQKYRTANPEKRAAWGAERRAAQTQRTPPWLNQAYRAEIEGVYHFAKIMERITGQKYHVDHVEPLQGKDVSGLHVPWNLQVLPARDNAAKGNRRMQIG